MKTHSSERSAATSSTHDFVDITDEISAALKASGISDGHVTVIAKDQDCALIVNERESGLFDDIRKAMDRVGPRGSLVGSRSVVLPAVGGALRLGGWQRVMLFELSGHAPKREVTVQVVGE